MLSTTIQLCAALAHSAAQGEGVTPLPGPGLPGNSV